MIGAPLLLAAGGQIRKKMSPAGDGSHLPNLKLGESERNALNVDGHKQANKKKCARLAVIFFCPYFFSRAKKMTQPEGLGLVALFFLWLSLAGSAAHETNTY